MTYSDYALICKALGDETRIKIFDMLKRGRMCACDILERFDFTQPTLSYHMKILCDSGLIQCDKQGTWNHYSINEEKLQEAVSFLNSKVVSGKFGCCD